MKKTPLQKAKLKKNVALGLVGGAIATIASGLIAVGICASLKDENLRDFRQSTEYKTAVTEKIAEADEIYQNSNKDFDAVSNYYKAHEEAYSIDYAKKLLNQGDNNYKQKDKNINIAAATSGITAGVGAILGIGLSAPVGHAIFNYEEEKRREKLNREI